MDAIAIITIILAVLTAGGVVFSALFNVKIKNLSLYWIISLLGAIILVLVNIRDIGSILGTLVENSSINPVKILVFFLCMTILSIVLDNLNFFNYVATKCTKLAKKQSIQIIFDFLLLGINSHSIHFK